MVNDANGFISNVWRAIKLRPDEVESAIDYPILEVDFHSRQDALVRQTASFHEQLMADPNWCDPVAAGWWLWGQSMAFGMYCSAETYERNKRSKPQTTTRNGVHALSKNIHELIGWYHQRMRHVIVFCGGWERLVTPAMLPQKTNHTAAIFLDPPYSSVHRDPELYGVESTTVAHEVREWAVANGDNPQLKIVLCGYEDEHEMPASWSCISWNAGGGWGNRRGSPNRFRERIWFSPACGTGQAKLF